MDIIKKEPFIQFLKNNQFGYYGISLQNNKKSDVESIEPIAIVAFVLSKMHEIDTNDKELYISKILSKKSDTGAFFTINKRTSVWATAQACLALNELECEVTSYEDSLMWLCKSQNMDGGWSYNGNFQNSSIIHSFYTTIILKKFQGIYNIIDGVLSKNIKYLKNIRDNSNEKATNRLIALYLLDVLKEEQDKLLIQAILINYMKEVITRQTDESYMDFDSENSYNYYIGFSFPSSYLLVRRFISPSHLFSQFLVRYLIKTAEPTGCWKPNMPNQSPTSWATALSLYTLFMWEADCEIKNLNFQLLDRKDIVYKLTRELEKIEMENDFITICPLNHGKCNLKSEIQAEFDEKRIFLDIPYNELYEDYENQIIHTIEDNGLIPVLAKDSTQSSILLCKVCRKIQSCKYGIADISEAKSNVYFELGLLYGGNRICAILKKSNIDLPTDLQGKEYIEYANTRELNEKLTKWIKDNILRV